MITKIACTIRLFAIAISFMFIHQTAYSQGYYNNNFVGYSQWDVAFNIGPSNFLGDVGGNKGKGTKFLKDMNTGVTNIFYGLHVTYYPAEWLGIRGSVNFGKLQGYDSLIKYEGGEEKSRKLRNLGFRSNISEVYLAAEVYPTVWFERREEMTGKIRPYFTVGIGSVHFNPQGEYTDDKGIKSWVNLRDLRLEGQGMSEYPDRKEYGKNALFIPFGIGVKYFLGERLFVGAEVLQRFTFTDYIDDVSKTYINPALFDKYLTPSQATIAKYMMFKRSLVNDRPFSNFLGKARGDATNNDYYLSVMLKIGFRIGTTDSDNPYRRPTYGRYY